jgi:hypothetical protein
MLLLPQIARLFSDGALLLEQRSFSQTAPLFTQTFFSLHRWHASSWTVHCY